MPTFTMLVLSNPVPGRESEYNDWYSNTHLADVTAIPGFLRAQRFELAHDVGFGEKWRYLATYEIETDDLEAALADLMSRQERGLMEVSAALDLANTVAGVFAACSPVVSAGAAPGAEG